jgi:hypothetical protein
MLPDSESWAVGLGAVGRVWTVNEDTLCTSLWALHGVNNSWQNALYL